MRTVYSAQGKEVSVVMVRDKIGLKYAKVIKPRDRKIVKVDERNRWRS